MTSNLWNTMYIMSYNNILYMKHYSEILWRLSWVSCKVHKRTDKEENEIL
jgi:hypothetical protein